MARADIGSRRDLLSRYVLITAIGIALYVATGRAIMLIWLLAYLVTNLAYCGALIRSTAPVDSARYRKLVALNMVTATVFSAMPLYLFTQDDVGLRVIAICGIAGHAMFNLSRHTQRNAVALWDTLSIVLSCIFVGLWQAFVLQGEPAQQFLVLLGSLAVAGYYAHAQLNALSTHENLVRVRSQAAQAQKMRAVGQLTSAIAHDFNNMLTVIRGNMELAELSTSHQERSQALQDAKQGADRAAGLVANLLAFARKARLSPEVISLPGFLRQFRIAAEQTLPSRVLVNVMPDSVPATVRADPVQLQASLLHIAINAGEAMGPRGGTLTLTARTCVLPARKSAESAPCKVSDLTPGEYVHFTLSDTGPGAPADMLDQLVEPFFTTKPFGQGSGLGLSMVKGFAEQSGGAVVLESPQGGGLHVHLYLPAGSGTAAADGPS